MMAIHAFAVDIKLNPVSLYNFSIFVDMAEEIDLLLLSRLVAGIMLDSQHLTSSLYIGNIVWQVRA